MTTTIAFVVKGTAIPKARPRLTKRGIAYTPSKTKEFENYVKLVGSQYAPKELLEGALEMELHFFFQRPKSLPKKVVHHLKKPDCDNIAKAILDSLEGIIYANDSQVVSLWATKQYGTPRVEVKITDDVWIGDLKTKRFEE